MTLEEWRTKHPSFIWDGAGEMKPVARIGNAPSDIATRYRRGERFKYVLHTIDGLCWGVGGSRAGFYTHLGECEDLIVSTIAQYLKLYGL